MPQRETGGGQQRGTRRNEEKEEVEASASPESDVQERHEKLTDDVDAMLDEIDEALETNAEDFVKGFVQKGGQ